MLGFHLRVIVLVDELITEKKTTATTKKQLFCTSDVSFPKIVNLDHLQVRSQNLYVNVLLHSFEYNSVT